MKRYLKEIELSGIILMFIGCILSRFFEVKSALWICGCGLLIWLFQVVYKALHWKEYSRDNKQNLFMMIACIILLWFIILYNR